VSPRPDPAWVDPEETMHRLRRIQDQSARSGATTIGRLIAVVEAIDRAQTRQQAILAAIGRRIEAVEATRRAADARARSWRP
jgi:hypothetical protein